MNALLHSMANSVDRRCYRRVDLAPGEVEIVLSQSASGMPDERLPVLNLSPEGVAVLVGATLLWPDQGAPVSFRAPALHIACRAYAAHETTGPNGTSVLGLRLDLEETDRHTVAAFYHARRFPALARRGAVPAAEVFGLLDRSGYLGLKKDIVPSDEWLAAPWPDILTREAVYRASDGTVLGHVSVTRAYRHTWLGHEIATLRTHPEAMECRRSLYHHFASWPRLLDGDKAMLLGYYNRDRPWHQRFFEEFAQAASPAECVLLPVERFATAPLDPATAVRLRITQVEIGEPDQHELRAVVGIIKRSWPPLALTAFDLDEKHLQSSCLHQAYEETGLSRSRTVLVLRGRQKVLGVALCESTNSRLSLFNILNGAQVFFDPDAEVSYSAQDALVQTVRRFYWSRGVDAPLIVSPPGALPGRAATGLEFVETMGCIIWSAAALKRYETYVDRALAEYVSTSGRHELSSSRSMHP